METANGVAIVIGATVASFAAAVLLGWAALVLLFRALPRPATDRSWAPGPGQVGVPGPIQST